MSTEVDMGLKDPAILLHSGTRARRHRYSRRDPSTSLRAGAGATSLPGAGATLAQSLPALCTSILSARVDFGTGRTRGPSWYQTQGRGGLPVFPGDAESCGWGHRACSAVANLI